MSARRLLVVTYYYPPQPGSGSNRWAAMVKYLRRLGHDVVVLTAAPPGHAPGTSDDVVRTASLNASPVLRRVLLRGAGTPAPPAATRAGSDGAEAAKPGDDRETDAASPPQPPSGGVLPPLLWKAIVPDPWLITWNPPAWRSLRRLLRESRFDCVITSSPAASTHLLACALGRHRPAWVADFRDGWTFEPLMPPFPTRLQRALDLRLERTVAEGADAVVGATAPIAEDLERRLGARALFVPNGFDPELTTGERRSELVDGGRMTFVHTGALLGSLRSSPRPLLDALRRVVDEDPSLADRVELLIAGRPEGDEAALLEQAALGGVVRHLGYLPREQALELQRAAGTLVLITSRNRACEATGKLYEYMAAGRPVIALAEGNEAQRIVAETNIGISVPPDDVDAIAGALRAAVAGDLERRYAPRGTAAYAYPLLAERMAAVVEAAIEHRATGAASCAQAPAPCVR